MNFIFILSLALVIVSIVGIFASIPIISDYAFWFAIGAYVVWLVAKSKAGREVGAPEPIATSDEGSDRLMVVPL